MKLKTGILAIFLVIGLLGVPNCIFAQQYEDSTSDAVITSNLPSTMHLNSLTPLVKSSSKGGSSSSASKAVKKIGGDDDDSGDGGDSGDSGWDWTTIIIILVVLFGIIGVLVWYFVLRK
jgi:hypothetical protein